MYATTTIHAGGTVIALPVYTDTPGLVRRTPWWMVSLVVHAAVLLMAALWIASEPPPQEDINFVVMDFQIFKRPEYEKRIKRDITRNDRVVDAEVIVETPMITPEELIVEEIETDNDMDLQTAQGNKDALSTVNLAENGWTTGMGLGSTGAGAYGDRFGGGKKDRIGKLGGGVETEEGVHAALEWFKRHQAADGSWSLGKYWDQCRDLPPCEHQDLGENITNVDACATGFALLCYLGAGHTQKAGTYRTQVANGLAYLRRVQGPDGSFSDNNYVHAITTMAVAEAYGMTRSAELRDMGQKAVAVILARQNEYMGWTYGNPATRNDTSVTGWQIMALKSAKASGFDIGNAFDGGKQFFDRITPAVQGDSEPRMDEWCAYTYYTDKDDPGHRNATCTAISLLCRVFMGQPVDDRTIRALAVKLVGERPTRYEDGDLYMWYYATMAMFQMQGDVWKAWNASIKDVLCNSQNKGGCEDGSWDPTTNFSCQRGGRIFATAVGCLTLEVYYRTELVKRK